MNREIHKMLLRKLRELGISRKVVSTIESKGINEEDLMVLVSSNYDRDLFLKILNLCMIKSFSRCDSLIRLKIIAMIVERNTNADEVISFFREMKSTFDNKKLLEIIRAILAPKELWKAKNASVLASTELTVESGLYMELIYLSSYAQTEFQSNDIRILGTNEKALKSSAVLRLGTLILRCEEERMSNLVRKIGCSGEDITDIELLKKATLASIHQKESASDKLSEYIEIKEETIVFSDNK